MIDLVREALIDELEQEFPQLKFVAFEITDIVDHQTTYKVVGVLDKTKRRKNAFKLQFEGSTLTTSIPPMGLKKFTAANVASCDLADPKTDLVNWTSIQIKNWLA